MTYLSEMRVCAHPFCFWISNHYFDTRQNLRQYNEIMIYANVILKEVMTGNEYMKNHISLLIIYSMVNNEERASLHLLTNLRPLPCVFEMSMKRIYITFSTTSRFILKQLEITNG